MTGEGGTPAAADGQRHAGFVARSGAVGLLPSQAIRALVVEGRIRGSEPIGEDQIQPASLDLRLGDQAWRVRASFLPGPGAMIRDRLEAFGMHSIDLSAGAVLEKGCVYIVPLMESLTLDASMTALANPKSSTGRLDVFTRLITDRAAVFDQVVAGYEGPLYAEISPRTFSIVVRRSMRLGQLRLRQDGGADPAIDLAGDGIAVTVDLAVGRAGEPVGWRARRHTDLIDLSRIAHYDPAVFWEPVRPDADGSIVLNPGDFYILASKEAVSVPPDQAAEMRPYDTRYGEFRVHYAGFFDPGFGFAGAGGAGSRAVLEIRSFDVPFVLRDAQLVGRLVYERLTDVPDKLYGMGIGSSYQRQGLALAKQFRRA